MFKVYLSDLDVLFLRAFAFCLEQETYICSWFSHSIIRLDWVHGSKSRNMMSMTKINVDKCPISYYSQPSIDCFFNFVLELLHCDGQSTCLKVDSLLNIIYLLCYVRIGCTLTAIILFHSSILLVSFMPLVEILVKQ